MFRKLHLNPGTACGTDAVGCFVTVVSGTAMGVNVTTWTRSCCTVDAQCTEIHEESEVGDVSGMVDQIGYVCSLSPSSSCNPIPLQVHHQRLQHDGPKDHYKH